MSEERRVAMAALAGRVDDINRQIGAIRETQKAFEANHLDLAARLDANTEITRRIEANTAGVTEAWNAAVGGLKVLGLLGRIAKWIGYIAGAVASVAAILHIGNGIRPK